MPEYGVTHPKALSPTARALFWYLAAKRAPYLEVARIVAESGIPKSSVYMAVRQYPDTFDLRGTTVGHSPAAKQLVMPSTPPGSA